MMIRILFVFVGILLIFPNAFAQDKESCPTYSYDIINIFSHDTNAFTQGLVFEDGILYESTGLYGRSSLRKVVLETGAIQKMIRLPDQIFGEGITSYKGRIIQLTWKSKLVLVFDRDNFTLLEKFYYPYQGWGITHDGRRLITSDGTSTIRFWDPEEFKEIGSVQVHEGKKLVDNINELEYVKGEIYANIWNTEKIVRFFPETGKVAGWIDLKALPGQQGPTRPVDVLNGIAYDPKGDRLFVTGKLWPKVFEIKLKRVY